MILDELVKSTQKNMQERQKALKLDTLRKKVTTIPITKNFSFEKKLADDNLSIIAEIKKASPSKGVLVNNFPYLQIAEEYAAADVTAISVLTEKDHFQGNIKILQEVAASTSIPILRKDFIIDSYMIYEAKVSGASIILLIVAILTDRQIKAFLKLADDLGMSVIVEVHNKQEIERALKAKARVIGINNRNLKTFDVNIQTTVQLKKYIPTDVLLISESGIKGKNEISALKHTGINGILVGEYLMHASDKKTTIADLRKVGNLD
ncbi:indole-3-glycerol phosphate synthase [Liquorilactobacillus aquaticus DSM 21051]|uniref:Indole-3-glycerol phosphate synthase n=1 Tax=Liquorilactobacillus aquaticus DSM 21051 TaxID=1423725 RepID=A0A0R2D6H2_9LACO|nr:indole-3-glycerol phosphate synthase TrpC [Liquorilactobacillus aquaticus]KRM96201.1 indole-3-glycerol phosphate synthase [Liquorilactobacillus aquaticus DSM 21051]